jgi:putative intracellular protease/amidase
MRILMIVAPEGLNSAPLTIAQVIEPYYRFADSGAEVVLASLCGGASIPTTAGPNPTASVLRFLSDSLAREALMDMLSLDQIFAEDFDAAYCFDAPQGPDATADHPASRLLAELLAAARPVALLSSGADKGMVITGGLPGPAVGALLGALGA